MSPSGYVTKLRSFLLGGRGRSARRRTWTSRRSASLPSSSYNLEPLEARVLLAADLAGVIQATTLLDPAVPTNGATATVQVQNQGNQRANATTQVAVYASLNSTFDATDVLLGTANTNALNAGQSRNVSVNLNIPNTLTPGTYSLLSRVDATNVIAEGTAGEANNVAAGRSFDVAWKFGAVPGRAGNTNLTLQDADGTRVTFSLAGGGIGEVIRDGSQWDVRLTDTTAQSVFTVLGLGGNNRVSLDDIQVDGPLGAVVAGNSDLTGTLAVNGPVGAGLLLGSATDAIIVAPTILGTTIQGVTVQGIAILGNLNQSTIHIGGNVGQDGQFGGTGANADTFGAGTLGDFFVGGSATASTVRVGVDPVDGIFGNGDDVILSGTNSSIDSIRINGALSADSRFCAGAFPATALIGGQSITTAGHLQFKTDVGVSSLTFDLTAASDTPPVGDQQTTQATVTLVGQTEANAAVTLLEPNLNTTADETGVFTFTNVSLGLGANTLTVRATDVAGNERSLARTITRLDSLSSGLISWFPANGNAEDVVGPHDGTLVNGTGFVPGKVGQAFSFDGIDDEVAFAHTSALNFGPTDSFTIGAWLKPSAADSAAVSLTYVCSPEVIHLAVDADGKASFVIRE